MAHIILKYVAACSLLWALIFYLAATEYTISS